MGEHHVAVPASGVRYTFDEAKLLARLRAKRWLVDADDGDGGGGSGGGNGGRSRWQRPHWRRQQRPAARTPNDITTGIRKNT